MEGIGKTRAFLTEFIIVILFFSLSAVITLQLFLAADGKSTLSTEQTNAYLKLQMIAEEVRGNGRYIDSFFSSANGWNNGMRYYNEEFMLCGQEEAAYVLTAQVTRQEEAAGSTAYITLNMSATDKQEKLGTLDVCVYEPEWRDVP